VAQFGVHVMRNRISFGHCRFAPVPGENWRLSPVSRHTMSAAGLIPSWQGRSLRLAQKTCVKGLRSRLTKLGDSDLLF
jgi:hypothetical protein